MAAAQQNTTQSTALAVRFFPDMDHGAADVSSIPVNNMRCHPERSRSSGVVKDLSLIGIVPRGYPFNRARKFQLHPRISYDNVNQTMLSSVSFFVARLGRRVFRDSALIVLFATLTLPVFSHAQELARRLILKDGSYQAVTKYEVKGDRVRYLSAERNEWEELPTSLVDWPATDKYEKERAAGVAAHAEVETELDKEAAKDRELNETKMPEVAPGLRLPLNSGVYLLDTYEGGPQLVEVQQTSSDLAQSGKVSVFRGVMNRTGSMKENIEIDGDHARVQSHVNVPSFYIKIDEDPAQPEQADKKTGLRPDEKSDDKTDNKKPDAAEQPSAKPAGTAQAPQKPQQPGDGDPYRIVRAEIKNGRRIVGDVKRAATGKTSQQQTFIKTSTSRIRGGWLKVTPVEALAPGEYAVVEMVGKEGMNLYVWDFGVNAKAPPNANPWKPESPADTKESAKPTDDSGDSQK